MTTAVRTRTYEYVTNWFDAKGYDPMDSSAEEYMNAFGSDGFRLVSITPIGDGITVITMEREIFT